MYVPKIRRLGGVRAVGSEGVITEEHLYQVCGGGSGICDSVVFGFQIRMNNTASASSGDVEGGL